MYVLFLSESPKKNDKVEGSVMFARLPEKMHRFFLMAFFLLLNFGPFVLSPKDTDIFKQLNILNFNDLGIF